MRMVFNLGGCAMKKSVLSILLIVILIFLSGCKSNALLKEESKLQIVTTVFPYYDFARNIAGDKADVTLLLQPGTEVHSYEPTPQDIIKIKESDLFINTGLQMDPWTDAVINDADKNRLAVLSAMECVDLIREDHNHTHSSTYFDPHVWTSPENAEEIVDEITDRLCRIDPENRRYYEKNEEIYSEKLEKLDNKFERLTEKRRNKPIVFADRFAIKYFADEYNLKYYSAYNVPHVSDIEVLVDIINKQQIPVVFYSETSNGQLPDTIVSETGAQKELFHTCHTVTKKELLENVSYLDLMEQNYKALKKALN